MTEALEASSLFSAIDHDTTLPKTSTLPARPSRLSVPPAARSGYSPALLMSSVSWMT